jgi:hypothetical protein
MVGRDQKEQASTHYLLDFLHEWSVSDLNGDPSFRSVQVRPRLREVVVVRRDGARDQRDVR